MTKTKRIEGHHLTLTVGVRYRASRPFSSRGRKVYPVTIESIESTPASAVRRTVIDGLSYDAANELLNGFNNGAMSFDGRIW